MPRPLIPGEARTAMEGGVVAPEKPDVPLLGNHGCQRRWRAECKVWFANNTGVIANHLGVALIIIISSLIAWLH